MSSVCQRRRFRDWLLGVVVRGRWLILWNFLLSLKQTSPFSKTEINCFLGESIFRVPLLHQSHFQASSWALTLTFKDILFLLWLQRPLHCSRIIHLMGASFALLSIPNRSQAFCLFLCNHFWVWSWHMLDNKERFIVWIHTKDFIDQSTSSHHLCGYTPLCAEASLCAVQACSSICPQEAHMASHSGREGARFCILGGPICTSRLPRWLRW